MIINIQNTIVTQNITTAVSHVAPTTEVTINERFYLYEFFRAPGLRYDPKEDDNTQQQVSVVSVDANENEESTNRNNQDEIRSMQDPSSDVVNTTTENEDKISDKEWARFPYMDAKKYGYRLCSVKELEKFKEDYEEMMKHSVQFDKCFC